jgi:hypothetical protein
LRIPPYSSQGKGKPFGAAPLKQNRETGTLSLPPTSGNPVKLTKSPLLKLITELWGLSSQPETSLMLERLKGLPVGERKEALLLQIILIKRKISLTDDQWDELWEKVRENRAADSLPVPGEDFSRGLDGGEGYIFSGEEVLYRLFEDGKGKGALILSLEEDNPDKMTLFLERDGRKWEFHLVRPGNKATGVEENGREGELFVYTDDEKLTKNPPPSWDKFRRVMAGYGIEMGKSIKSLQEDSFFTDKGNREPDHMVDIVL